MAMAAVWKPRRTIIQCATYVVEQFDAGARHKDEGIFGLDCMTV